jgi:hypothetical protein
MNPKDHLRTAQDWFSVKYVVREVLECVLLREGHPRT